MVVWQTPPQQIPVPVVQALLLATVSTSAQAPKPEYNPPKTPWGDPDIQGTYDYQTYIPLERPLQWAGKQKVTEADVIAWRKRNGNSGL